MASVFCFSKKVASVAKYIISLKIIFSIIFREKGNICIIIYKQK